MKSKIIVVVVLISASTYTTGIQAQLRPLEQGSILSRPMLMQGIVPESPQVQFKLIHSNFEESDGEFFSSNVSMSSGSYLISGSFPIGERGAVEVSLPYHIFKLTTMFEIFGETESDEMSLKDFGNIRVNYIQRIGQENSEFQHYAVVGAYLPTAGEEAFGAFDNYYDIFSFIDESFTLRGTYVGIKRLSTVTISLEAGPDFFFPTEDNGDAEIFAHYGIGLSSSPIENLAVRAELVGLGIISEEDIGSGSRFRHQAALGGRYQFGRIVSGLFYTLNMNDLRDFNDSSIGVEVGIEL